MPAPWLEWSRGALLRALRKPPSSPVVLPVKTARVPGEQILPSSVNPVMSKKMPHSIDLNLCWREFLACAAGLSAEKPVHLSVGYGILRQRVVSSFLLGFAGNTSQQSHGSHQRPRSHADSLDAPTLQLANRRHARSCQNVHRRLHALHDRANVLRQAQAGNKHAITSGAQISLPAFDRVAQRLLERRTLFPVSISAGINHQMYS